MKSNHPICYDICCGAGVFSLGFKTAGFQVMGGVDNNIQAISTAKRNMPEGNWQCISIERFSQELKNDKYKINKPIDVILAGLPCQGFSYAGNGNLDDKRNELYKYLHTIVQCIKPSYVVVENVKGLITPKFKEIFRDMQTGFRKIGYDVGYRIYNAANFGTPQNRKRIFIIASKEHPVRYLFEGIRFTNKTITVRQALAGLDMKNENPENNHTFMQHSRDVRRRIRKIREGKLKPVISYRILKWNKRSLTIISGHNALPVHPQKNRAISNREGARIQGIPDSFIFNGTRTGQTSLVANAVPVSVAASIARATRNAPQRIKSVQGPLYRKLQSKTSKRIVREINQFLVEYYKKEGRIYPWRKTTNPYTILLTEILLQRTKADMVDEIWRSAIKAIKPAGKKYRTNIRLFKQCIKKIGIHKKVDTVKQLNRTLIQYFENKVPDSFEELTSLPGVGLYIASAVRTFAYGIPDFPVDTNSFRFFGRYFGLKITVSKKNARQIREFMNTIIMKDKTKEFVYGFLDFCAGVCSPRHPKCNLCSLSRKCKYNHRIFCHKQ